MFNQFADTVIDAVQTAKKASVDFIPHQDLKKTLVGFVDAQTKYTKEAAKAGSDFMLKLSEIAMDRTPYVEAQKNFGKFFPSNAFAPSKKAK